MPTPAADDATAAARVQVRKELIVGPGVFIGRLQSQYRHLLHKQGEILSITEQQKKTLQFFASYDGPQFIWATGNTLKLRAYKAKNGKPVL